MYGIFFLAKKQITGGGKEDTEDGAGGLYALKYNYLVKIGNMV